MDFNDFSKGLNAKNLQQENRIKEDNKNLYYDKIYHRACNRIQLSHKKNKDNCIFEIPKFLIGVPKYDITSCIYYVIQKLRENDFQVQLLTQNYIYISWVEETIVNEKKKKQDFLALEKNNI